MCAHYTFLAPLQKNETIKKQLIIGGLMFTPNNMLSPDMGS